jgi:high-affinity nickel-transport protein
MFMLGLLFGLGFDTATEIAMFSMSARQISAGVPFGAILVLPALFAAGMALVDTTDGVVMLGAYKWAFVKPIRKLYYNMTITLISVCIAILIGGIETLGLIGNKFELNGAPWRWVAELNSNFNNLGFAVIGVFVFAWMLSYIVYRARRLDDLVVEVPARQSWNLLE